MRIDVVGYDYEGVMVVRANESDGRLLLLGTSVMVALDDACMSLTGCRHWIEAAWRCMPHQV